MSNPTIATLITCFNRKQKTLDCLAALIDRSVGTAVTSIYLVDDGSTDGTAAAVRAAYPQVQIVQGDGQLFWNGGMRLAFATALERDYDYYLWLNDDTILYPHALSVLLQTAERLAAQETDLGTIVVGSTCDPDTGTFTYGGMLQQSWWRPMRLARVEPSDTPQKCDTVNGNCVLISRSVVRVVGNLDPAFTHYMGDLDYGLRAHKHGCNIWVAPGYLGTCAENARPSNWHEVFVGQSWHHQLQQMGSPKGLNFTTVTLSPLAEWKAFAQRHAGPLWPIYWLSPYRRLLLAPIANLYLRFQKSYRQSSQIE
jgi:GT2 family glycosyltransferase